MNLTEKFRRWDKGLHTFTPVEESIRKINPGKHFGKKTLELLKQCTACPVGNASCTEHFEIVVHGFHPEKPIKNIAIPICPHGCNADTCLLNK